MKGDAVNVWCGRCGKYMPLAGPGVVVAHDKKGVTCKNQKDISRLERNGNMCPVSGMNIMEALDDADEVAAKKGKGKK